MSAEGGTTALYHPRQWGERNNEMRVIKRLAAARKAWGAFAIASILLGAYGCGNRAPSRDLPATFVWSKDQSVIDPASGRTNVWGGFEVKNGAFTAVRNTARFILWRKTAVETPSSSPPGKPAARSMGLPRQLALRGSAHGREQAG
jgi:hypothetical protein